MTELLQNEHHPTLVSAPGETLLETLETRGVPQTELAKQMGIPVRLVNEIVQGKAAITPEIASQLERIFEVSASFWLRRERSYRESLARLVREPRLQDWVKWLKEIPIQSMMELGWVPTCTEGTLQVLEALKFFDVASPEEWLAIWECTVVTYCGSGVSANEFGARSAWLRQGEIEAQIIDCSPYNEERFRK